MLTNVLEIVGLVLLVAAALVTVGAGAALATGGGCCLFVSWSVNRT